MKKIFEIQTTQFDLEFINHIKTIRKEKNFTKDELSLAMGVAKSFVSNVESFTQRHKYSTRHIALLAKVFEFKNIADLLDFPTPQYDKIKVTVMQTMNKSGTKALSSQVMKIDPLNK